MRAILPSIFFFFVSITTFAQISGKIVDNNNEPLPAVNVLVKGTQKGTETDFDGNFTIKNISGNQELVISSIGYKTKEVQVTAPNNNLSITLFEGNELLQEVVLQGRNNTFARKKTAYVAKLPLKDIENASVYSTVTTEILESQLVTNLDEAMTNATGVYKLWESTGRGAGSKGGGTSFYTSRGFSIQPRLVDGIAGTVFGAVDPSYVERIETLKGPSATLFGSTETSLGGLINVVTKKPFKGTGGNVSYTIGSFGLHRSSVDYNTPLGSGDNVFLRINASYLTQGSFQDAGFKKSFFIAPSLTFKVNERFNISLGIEASKTRQTNPSMLFLSRGFPLLSKNIEEIGIDPKKSFTSNDIYLTNPVFNTRLIGDYKISDQWTSKTVFSGTYSESKGDYQYQFDGGAGGILLLQRLSQPLTSGITQAQGGIAQLEAAGANNSSSPLYQQYLQALGALSVLNNTNNSLNFILGDASGLLSKNAFTRVFSKRDANNTKFNIQQNFIGDFKIGELRNRMVIGLDYLNNKDVNRNKNGNPDILQASQFPQLLNGLQLLGQTKALELVRSGFGAFPYFDVFLGADGSVVPNSFTPNGTYTPNKANLDNAFAQVSPLNKRISSQVLSAYVSDVINFTPQLTVNLGLRLDHFIQDGDITTTLDDYEKTTFSPSAGILYQPIQNKLSVFANYQTGFVNNDPEINLNKNTVLTFAPTKAKQFEGGVKTNFFNGRLNLGASYYHITAEDFLASDPSAQVFPVSADVKEVVSKGFEFELNANPVRGLNIRASYSKNDMKYTDVTSEKVLVRGVKDADGNPVYGRDIIELLGRRPVSAGPENLYNFWADYSFPEESFAKNFGIGAGFNGASEQLTVNNAVSGEFALPSYTIFNASIYYNADKFRIGVKANNFTNKIYYTGWSTINAQAPRSFLGTISYKF